MYRTISDFINAWNYEHASTTKIFNALTDASLAQKVTPDGRSLGSMAWHITLTLGEMGRSAGLTFAAPEDHATMPAKSSEIAAIYAATAVALGKAVQEHWNDASLSEEIMMYGEKWTKGGTLSALVSHQIHHRAQMTVLMRQAGLKVPGVYGPSKEEWAHIGMTAPE